MKARSFLGAVAGLVLVLTGCTAPWAPTPASQGKNMTDSYSYTQEETPGEKEEFTWVIEPTISADNIIVFDGSVVDPDHEDNKAYSEYAVMRLDGKYGLINYKGSVVIEPQYEDYYTCWCGEIVLYNVVDPKNEVYEYCTVDSAGTISYTVPDHRDNSPTYYWATNKEKVLVMNKGADYATEYTGKKAVAVVECTASESGGQYDIDVEDGAFCGLAKKGELLTGIDYVDYYAPAYKGSGATCIAFKDTQGKWGYLDSDGQVLIDFKLDGDINAYNGEVMDDMSKSHPYLFNNDFVPVCINGAYGYYDREGQVVVTPGDVGQARPVHNGRAWVRVGNYWGVMQLGEIVEAAPQEYKDPTTSTSTRTSTSTTTKTSTTTTTTSASSVTSDTSLTVSSWVPDTSTETLLSDTETVWSDTEPVLTDPPATETTADTGGLAAPVQSEEAAY